MNIVATDVFDGAMQGLEAGFRVLHIATFDLKTCNASDDIESALKDPELAGFDHIPVQQDSRIIGLLERQAGPGSGPVARHMRQIDPSYLVAAEAPLRAFIPLVAENPYWLVVRIAGIQGIVTRSDLFKLPVRLHIFTMVTHLETVMADVIRTHSRSDNWLALLGDMRRKKVRERQRRLQIKSLDPPLVELTDFYDKTIIVEKLLHLGKDFTESLDNIRDLRNKVAHGVTYVNNNAQVRNFVERISAAEKWIERLRI
ncbi:MAG TPA: hypothetical protein VFE33_21165 [Thermoanaerobaculia bacterium]|nr:hypothetical protein [Thermoanaerobaculia bacterium]